MATSRAAKARAAIWRHLWSALLIGQVAAPAVAKDYFLTIGGGYDTASNQASIERNVLLLRATLEEKRPDQPTHEVYFADGDAPVRDVQYLDPGQRERCPPARRIMTEIFGDEHAIGICYRDHGVPDVRGATEKRALESSFQRLGRELKSGDRLFVYATGHGSQATGNYDYDYRDEEWVEKEPENGGEVEYNKFDTHLYLWNSESITARDFTRWLDRLPADVTVVMVMVQCYSGGFSHAIFHQNDAHLGLGAGRRCGFFAQVHDRPAAGCTPEVQEGDGSPHEYSTFFWTALRGKTPAGATVAADYDGNGQVSLAEAHAYAVIESETIDIPVRTSEELLRTHSRLAGRGKNKQGEDDDEENSIGRFFGLLASKPAAGDESKQPAAELLGATGLLSALFEKARPDQRAVLEQLSEKLGLGQAATFESARVQLRRATTELATATVNVHTAASSHEQTLEDLKADVYELWPELNAGITPAAGELMSERAEEFASAVEALPGYQAFRKASGRVAEANDRFEAAQKAEARAQRLIRTAETVALAANLPLTAPTEIVKRYEEMIACEEEPLGVTEPVNDDAAP